LTQEAGEEDDAVEDSVADNDYEKVIIGASAMSESETMKVSQQRNSSWQKLLRGVVTGQTTGFESPVSWADVPDDIPQELKLKVRQELAKQLYVAVRYHLRNASKRTLGDESAYKEFMSATISGHLVKVTRQMNDDNTEYLPIPEAFKNHVLGIQQRPGGWGMDPRKALGRVRRKQEKAKMAKKTKQIGLQKTQE